MFVVGCHETSDDCARARARLDRIDASRGTPLLSGEPRREALEQCRHGRYAAYDPVLRCAMDSATDEAAAACIDAFDREMGTARGGGAPAGINPLVEQPGQPK